MTAHVHGLFDAEIATVDPDQPFRLSRNLKDELQSTSSRASPTTPSTARRSGSRPPPREHPSRKFLRWHADVVFRG